MINRGPLASSSGPTGRVDHRFERDAVGGRSLAHVGIEGRVDVAVLRLDHRAIRIHVVQIAEDGCGAARRDSCGLLVVAHQRRHLVPGAHECVEHSGTDVAGATSEEDAHGEGYSLLRLTTTASTCGAVFADDTRVLRGLIARRLLPATSAHQRTP